MSLLESVKTRLRKLDTNPNPDEDARKERVELIKTLVDIEIVDTQKRIKELKQMLAAASKNENSEGHEVSLSNEKPHKNKHLTLVE